MQLGAINPPIAAWRMRRRQQSLAAPPGFLSALLVKTGRNAMGAVREKPPARAAPASSMAGKKKTVLMNTASEGSLAPPQSSESSLIDYQINSRSLYSLHTTAATTPSFFQPPNSLTYNDRLSLYAFFQQIVLLRGDCECEWHGIISTCIHQGCTVFSVYTLGTEVSAWPQ